MVVTTPESAGSRRSATEARTRSTTRSWLPILAFLLLAAGALVYHAWVFLPGIEQQRHELGITGVWSDLYARWYGSRELLLHGREPYSAEITREMQQGFYGREAAPGKELPEVAVFAQPLYTAFLLAPLTLLDFELVKWLTSWLFPLCVVAGALLWQALVGREKTPGGMLLVALLAISWPATQNLGNMQQLTGPVFLLLAATTFLVARRHYGWAGVVLALSTIKPQEGAILIAVLLVWSLACWRERWPLVLGFSASMLALTLASEMLVPGWIYKFVESLVRYSENTAEWRILAKALPGWVLAPFAIATLAAMGWATWRVRRLAGDDSRFLAVQAAALVVALVLLPTHQLYEGVLALPALLLIWASRAAWASRTQKALLYGGILPLLLAPWLIAAAFGWLEVLGVPLHAQPEAIRSIPWPFYLMMPHVCAMALLLAFSRLAGNSRRAA